MRYVKVPCFIAATLVTACGGCSSQPPPQPMLAPMQPSAPLPPPPPAIAAPCAQAQILATSTTMQARAAAEAPGMKPEGEPVCGVVNAPGDTVVSAPFVLEPGYCYTFLGQSLPPMAEMEMLLQLDASGLVTALLPPSMAGNMANQAQAALLVSTTPGERVSMGEKQMCYQPPPLPGTVRLIMRSRNGAGPMAAQVFRKKKL